MIELANGVAYSCEELAALKIPGYPVTRQGWDALVKRDSWEFTEVKSKGRGGIRREYLPPDHLRQQIEIQRRIHDATSGNVPLHMMEAVEARYREAVGPFAPPPERRPESDRQLVRDNRYVVTEPLPFEASLNAETVRPGPELLAKAIFALMEMSEIPQGLTLDQRTALMMRLFSLLMMACGADEAKLKRLIETPDTLKAALRFAWELYRSET